MTIYPLMNTLVSVLTLIALIALLIFVLVKMRPGQPRTLAGLGAGCLLASRVWSLIFYQMTSGILTGFNEVPLILNLVVSNLLYIAGVFLLAYAAVKAVSAQVRPLTSQVQQPYGQFQQPPAQQPIPQQGAQDFSQPQYGFQSQEQQTPQPSTRPEQYGYQPQEQQTQQPEQYDTQPGFLSQEQQAPQPSVQDPAPQNPGQSTWGKPDSPYGQPPSPFAPPQG